MIPHGTPVASSSASRHHAAIAVGADAVMVDVHGDPTQALCDGPQALYGEDRLIRTLRGLLGARNAGMIIDGIVKDVDDFANGAEQADDITLLAFKLVSLVS